MNISKHTYSIIVIFVLFKNLTKPEDYKKHLNTLAGSNSAGVKQTSGKQLNPNDEGKFKTKQTN